MKLRLRFSIFFAVGLFCFIIYMGLVIGLILEYIFPLLNLDNSGDNLISFLTVFLIPFISGGVIFGLYFVNPVLYMMSLIEKLSKGQYDLSEAEYKLYTKSGKLKKRYSLYREIITNTNNLAQTLEQAAEVRKKLEDTKENWIRGISHDIKTPLTYIVGYSALLENNNYNWSQEEIRSFAKEIYIKGKTIEDLIGDLRQTFHMENTEIPLSKETFDLIPFMQTLITDIAKMPGAEKSELNITEPIAHVNLRADKKLIRRAFQNILVNAIYHNPPHTQIIVKINPPQDGTVSIEFRDNGTGVNKAIIDKISNNKPKPKNLHGLDIVKSIITAHNGNITIESKNKQGSHFHIQLPTEETTNQKNQS